MTRGVFAERPDASGGVGAAGGVLPERLVAGGCAGAAGGISLQRFKAVGSITSAGAAAERYGTESTRATSGISPGVTIVVGVWCPPPPNSATRRPACRRG